MFPNFLWVSLILNLNQLNFRKVPLLFRDRVLISYSHIQFQKNQQIFSLNVGLEEDKTSHSFLLRVVFLPSISSTQVFGVTWHEIIMELFGV